MYDDILFLLMISIVAMGTTAVMAANNIVVESIMASVFRAMTGIAGGFLMRLWSVDIFICTGFTFGVTVMGPSIIPRIMNGLLDRLIPLRSDDNEGKDDEEIE